MKQKGSHARDDQKYLVPVAGAIFMLLVLPNTSGSPLRSGQPGLSDLSLGQGEKSNPGVSDFGVRLDNDLQDCNGTQWKKTFPDLDFALLGYDILHGDPNAECDPGFTHPIFKADYSERRQSADCRYSVPVGLTVYPCQSCLVSFESKLVRNKQEMSKHLGAAAKLEGGGWGFQFSASASYKRDVAEMSSGEYVRVISSAQCQYYRSHIDLTRPPPFHPGFIEWATKLADPRATDGDVLQFVKYYGTHFFSDVTFGAKFIQSHKISQAALTTLRKESISVEVQASYSGLFSIGGGFSMDSDQRNAASKFMKNVQTTTITVGSSPPSNGDAMTWAASVQSNPVPTKYTLTGIEDLFTDHFTRHLSPKVNYGRLKKRLASAAYKYCQVLKMQGKVSSCKNSYNVGGTDIGFTQKGYKYIRDVDRVTCEEICLDDVDCVAVEFRNFTSTICSFFKGDVVSRVVTRQGSQIIVFLSQLATNKKVLPLEKANFRGYAFKAPRHDKPQDCRRQCEDELECDAYSWNSSRSLKCSLFLAKHITNIRYSSTSQAAFVQNK